MIIFRGKTRNRLGNQICNNDETQDGFRESTCDFEEVRTVGCKVCRAFGVLRQVEEDRWDKEPWRSVWITGEEGLKFKQVLHCVVKVKSGGEASELET